MMKQTAPRKSSFRDADVSTVADLLQGVAPSRRAEIVAGAARLLRAEEEREQREQDEQNRLLFGGEEGRRFRLSSIVGGALPGTEEESSGSDDTDDLVEIVLADDRASGGAGRASASASPSSSASSSDAEGIIPNPAPSSPLLERDVVPKHHQRHPHAAADSAVHQPAAARRDFFNRWLRSTRDIDSRWIADFVRDPKDSATLQQAFRTALELAEEEEDELLLGPAAASIRNRDCADDPSESFSVSTFSAAPSAEFVMHPDDSGAAAAAAAAALDSGRVLSAQEVAEHIVASASAVPRLLAQRMAHAGHAWRTQEELDEARAQLELRRRNEEARRLRRRRQPHRRAEQAEADHDFGSFLGGDRSAAGAAGTSAAAAAAGAAELIPRVNIVAAMKQIEKFLTVKPRTTILEVYNRNCRHCGLAPVHHFEGTVHSLIRKQPLVITLPTFAAASGGSTTPTRGEGSPLSKSLRRSRSNEQQAQLQQSMRKDGSSDSFGGAVPTRLDAPPNVPKDLFATLDAAMYEMTAVVNSLQGAELEKLAQDEFGIDVAATAMANHGDRLERLAHQLRLGRPSLLSGVPPEIADGQQSLEQRCDALLRRCVLEKKFALLLDAPEWKRVRKVAEDKIESARNLLTSSTTTGELISHTRREIEDCRHRYQALLHQLAQLPPAHRDAIIKLVRMQVSCAAQQQETLRAQHRVEALEATLSERIKHVEFLTGRADEWGVLRTRLHRLGLVLLEQLNRVVDGSSEEEGAALSAVLLHMPPPKVLPAFSAAAAAHQSQQETLAAVSGTFEPPAGAAPSLAAAGSAASRRGSTEKGGENDDDDNISTSEALSRGITPPTSTLREASGGISPGATTLAQAALTTQSAAGLLLAGNSSAANQDAIDHSVRSTLRGALGRVCASCQLLDGTFPYCPATGLRHPVREFSSDHVLDLHRDRPAFGADAAARWLQEYEGGGIAATAADEARTLGGTAAMKEASSPTAIADKVLKGDAKRRMNALLQQRSAARSMSLSAFAASAGAGAASVECFSDVCSGMFHAPPHLGDAPAARARHHSIVSFVGMLNDDENLEGQRFSEYMRGPTHASKQMMARLHQMFQQAIASEHKQHHHQQQDGGGAGPASNLAGGGGGVGSPLGTLASVHAALMQFQHMMASASPSASVLNGAFSMSSSKQGAGPSSPAAAGSSQQYRNKFGQQFSQMMNYFQKQPSFRRGSSSSGIDDSGSSGGDASPLSPQAGAFRAVGLNFDPLRIRRALRERREDTLRQCKEEEEKRGEELKQIQQRLIRYREERSRFHPGRYGAWYPTYLRSQMKDFSFNERIKLIRDRAQLDRGVLDLVDALKSLTVRFKMNAAEYFEMHGLDEGTTLQRLELLDREMTRQVTQLRHTLKLAHVPAKDLLSWCGGMEADIVKLQDRLRAVLDRNVKAREVLLSLDGGAEAAETTAPVSFVQRLRAGASSVRGGGGNGGSNEATPRVSVSAPVWAAREELSETTGNAFAQQREDAASPASPTAATESSLRGDHSSSSAGSSHLKKRSQRQVVICDVPELTETGAAPEPQPAPVVAEVVDDAKDHDRDDSGADVHDDEDGDDDAAEDDDDDAVLQFQPTAPFDAEHQLAGSVFAPTASTFESSLDRHAASAAGGDDVLDDNDAATSPLSQSRADVHMVASNMSELLLDLAKIESDPSSIAAPRPVGPAARDNNDGATSDEEQGKAQHFFSSPFALHSAARLVPLHAQPHNSKEVPVHVFDFDLTARTPREGRGAVAAGSREATPRAEMRPRGLVTGSQARLLRQQQQQQQQQQGDGNASPLHMASRGSPGRKQGSPLPPFRAGGSLPRSYAAASPTSYAQAMAMRAESFGGTVPKKSPPPPSRQQQTTLRLASDVQQQQQQPPPQHQLQRDVSSAGDAAVFGGEPSAAKIFWEQQRARRRALRMQQRAQQSFMDGQVGAEGHGAGLPGLPPPPPPPPVAHATQQQQHQEQQHTPSAPTASPPRGQSPDGAGRQGAGEKARTSTPRMFPAIRNPQFELLLLRQQQKQQHQQEQQHQQISTVPTLPAVVSPPKQPPPANKAPPFRRGMVPLASLGIDVSELTSQAPPAAQRPAAHTARVAAPRSFWGRAQTRIQVQQPQQEDVFDAAEATSAPVSPLVPLQAPTVFTPPPAQQQQQQRSILRAHAHDGPRMSPALDFSRNDAGWLQTQHQLMLGGGAAPAASAYGAALDATLAEAEISRNQLSAMHRSMCGSVGSMLVVFADSNGEAQKPLNPDGYFNRTSFESSHYIADMNIVGVDKSAMPRMHGELRSVYSPRHSPLALVPARNPTVPVAPSTARRASPVVPRGDLRSGMAAARRLAALLQGNTKK